MRQLGFVSLALVAGIVRSVVADQPASTAPDQHGLYVQGNVLLRAQKKYDEAIAKFTEQLEKDPNHVLSLIARAECWVKKNDLGRAVRDLSDAIRIDPKSDLAYAERSKVYLAQGNVDSAMSDCNQALQINDVNTKALHSRAKAWEKKGNWDNAIRDQRMALRLGDPKDAWNTLKDGLEMVLANPNVPALFDQNAWIQATSPYKQVRNGNDAVVGALAACDMTKYKNWAYLATLSAAYAEKGDFENAVTWAQKALDLASAAERSHRSAHVVPQSRRAQ